MTPAVAVIVAFIALTMVAVIGVAVLAGLRSDPARPRLPYELFLRLTGLCVFTALVGSVGALAGFAFLLGGAS